MGVYHVPVRLHGRRAKTKAAIAFGVRFDGAIVPSAGARTEIVTVEAETHEEAYRKLCAAVLPDDKRLIMCKRAIRLLRDKPRHCAVDHASQALIGADYLDDHNLPSLAESVRLMVRDATARRAR